MLLKNILLASVTLFAKAYSAAAPNPDQAVQLIFEGNDHFVQGKMTHRFYSEDAKDQMLDQQTPIAAIVGCSDSRVPPELIFDRGFGELFVVRDAGNVVGPIEMDSVEYAVNGLKVPLVVVLGHQNCGAVKATLAGQDKYPELDTIIPLISSGLKKCDRVGADLLKNAIYCNIRNSVRILENSPTIAPLIKEKKVKIIGAYYEITTGKVSLVNN